MQTPGLGALARRTALSLILSIVGATASVAPASATTLAELAIADTTVPHEAAPEGVPRHWSWALSPRLNRGSDATGYNAVVPWGQVYNCATGNPQPQAQVELRDLQGFVLSRSTGKWRAITVATLIQGSAFREDYADNSSVAATVTTVPGLTLLTMDLPGRNFHFWPKQNRAAMDPADVAGVTVVMRARLRASTVRSALAKPCLLVSVGADYWTTQAATWDNFGSSADVGMGRMKKVDLHTRLFSMTTVSPEVLQANPLPLVTTVGELR